MSGVNNSSRYIAYTEIGTSGYMRIRWYQQSVHGSSPQLRLKLRLPSVAIVAVINMIDNKYCFILAVFGSICFNCA